MHLTFSQCLLGWLGGPGGHWGTASWPSRTPSGCQAQINAAVCSALGFRGAGAGCLTTLLGFQGEGLFGVPARAGLILSLPRQSPAQPLAQLLLLPPPPGSPKGRETQGSRAQLRGHCQEHVGEITGRTELF